MEICEGKLYDEHGNDVYFLKFIIINEIRLS